MRKTSVVGAMSPDADHLREMKAAQNPPDLVHCLLLLHFSHLCRPVDVGHLCVQV